LETSTPFRLTPHWTRLSIGWTGEWLYPGNGPRYRLWWFKDDGALTPPLAAGSGDVAEPTTISNLYVSDFSGRALPGQQLDVLAPGSWVRGPFAGDPGYNHLPWWSKGVGDLVGGNQGNFYCVGGTSMATPHVASVAALMLQKNPALTQSAIEFVLKASALALPPTDSRSVFDFNHWAVIDWDTLCGSVACDAVGAGVIQADVALSMTPAGL
jgi:subtilisin family serine protease